MMVLKKIILVWIAILILVLLFLAQEKGEVLKAGESTTVSKIMENYIRAAGGSALAEIKTETRKGTMLRGVTGKVPLETMAITPGKWRYDQTFAWGDRVCYGFDGAIAWVQDTKGVSRMSPRQRLDLQLLLDVQAPLNIRNYYPEMAIKGSEKFSDTEAAIVLATSYDGIKTELAFDNETGLLLRAGEMVFEDYRDVGHVKRPFRILLGKDEGEKHLQMKMQFSEIRHDLGVDDARFELPACVLPMAEAPLYKHRIQAEVSPEAMETCVGKYRHPERPEVVFTVTRQQNHLLLGRTDWGGQRFEIIPASESDYFIEFLNQDFRFSKDPSGKVTHLEITADRTLKAERSE